MYELDTIQKYKLGRLINRLESGRFDDLDIDLLLIFIRDFKTDDRFLYFKDICHFIAHPTRDRGKIKDEIDKIYFYILYRNLYNQQQSLDCLNFPIWLKDFMLLQLDYFAEYKLPFNKQKCRQYINNVIKNESGGIVVSNNKNFLTLFGVLMSEMQIKYIISQKTFISELIELLEKFEIVINTKSLKRQSTKIMFYILYMLHGKIISLDKYRNATLKIFENGNRLSLYATIEIFNNTVSFELISTQLKTNEWIKDGILNIPVCS